jgi:hypothetical protein
MMATGRLSSLIQAAVLAERMRFFCHLRAILQSLLMTRRLSRWTFVFLGLGICVFTWGLQYKLSLYYPPHSSFHQVPAAKLLSKNEQPRIALNLPSERQKKAASNIQQLSLTALMLAWLTGLTLGLALAAERRFLPRGLKPWLLAGQASLDAFLFRPPPISA